MTLTVLRRTSQVCSWDRLREEDLTSEVKCPSCPIISRVHVISMIDHCCCRPSSPGDRFIFERRFSAQVFCYIDSSHSHNPWHWKETLNGDLWQILVDVEISRAIWAQGNLFQVTDEGLLRFWRGWGSLVPMTSQCSDVDLGLGVRLLDFLTCEVPLILSERVNSFQNVARGDS